MQIDMHIRFHSNPSKRPRFVCQNLHCTCRLEPPIQQITLGFMNKQRKSKQAKLRLCVLCLDAILDDDKVVEIEAIG